MSSAIISVGELKARLAAGKKIVLADVRFSPEDTGYGRSAYERGHLPGAVFVDFKKDLTDPPREHGGRSPLPMVERLSELFGWLGIDRTTAVVVYGDGNGPAASRLWWVLHYLGHDQVYVLDGGYDAWVADGLPVTQKLPVIETRIFESAPRSGLLVDVDDVRAVINEERNALLIDSRDASQFLGLEAPFDPVAGHIPGARHYFWKDALQENGSWKSPEQLRERFAAVADHDEIIVYCGSGISATPNVLALKEAGFGNVKLYAGSWSDWISYSENPVATGEE